MYTKHTRSYLYSLAVLTFIVITSCQNDWPKELADYKSQLPDVVDYNFHVKPILSDRCYKCHGPDENQLKSNFRIDGEDTAFKRTESNSSTLSSTIVNGNPLSSEVVSRILSDDSELKMPPPDSHLSLSDRDKAMLVKWIDQGAKFKPHWSFIPPEPQEVPSADNDWAYNEIDHFIYSKMKENSLSPSLPEEKINLLRRIHMDITGLPPSVEDLDLYSSSTDPSIYEKTVDRLLESSHYGEHMTLRWLDLARYADTHGYQDDGLRTAWPYRDWVINAYNDNMPFDQFLVEQLAGDLLPNPTKDQLVATCFLRNHPQTQEGGIVDEEYRVEYVADRTNTFGKAMLGLTMECARCHDHKYDPLSQKDYYSLYAYFNNNNESGIVPYVGEASPTVILPTQNQSRQLDSLKNLIQPIEEKLASENFIEDFKKWYASVPDLSVEDVGLLANFDLDEIAIVDKSRLNLDGKKSPGWGGIGKKGATHSLMNKAKNSYDAALFGDADRMPEIVKGIKGNALKFIGDCGFRFNRDLDLDRNEQISVSLWIKIDNDDASGPIFNNTNGNFEGYRGWLAKLNNDHTLSIQFNHVWPDNSIDYQTTTPLPKNEWTHLAVTYDGSSEAEGLNVYVNGKRPEMNLHRDNLTKSMLNGKDGKNWSSMPFLIGKELTQSLLEVSLDELKVYNRELSRLEVEKLFSNENEEGYEEKDLLKHYVQSRKNKTYNDLVKQLTDLRHEENVLVTDMTEVMIMNERKSPRKSFILDRGVYDSPLAEVNPELPELLNSSEQLKSDRLGLAQWLVSKDNPLTARVAVNRIWAMIFGKGLVQTIDDFGNQGSLPSHPELLDWLAIDFMENRWDMKRLVKQILMTNTYQQSGYADQEIEAKDPQNQWYTRFPRHRLTAEAIRDRALYASGLMIDKVGGPSVYPYQPSGLWKELATRNETVYKQGSGDDLYRRSMYTIWKRSSPPPSMMNFDAPDRFICTVDRQKTSTPLQSLVLMNDPQFLEAAKILALNTLKAKPNNERDQINYIFKALINRPASDEELGILAELRDEERHSNGESSNKILDLLKIGESEIEQAYYTPELTSLMIVASTVMNYDEFVLKA
jgi:hypothetical protein